MTTPQKVAGVSQTGVKKNHFTPCRRIGLSRIIKTPSNTPKSKTIKETNSVENKPWNAICADEVPKTALNTLAIQSESKTTTSLSKLNKCENDNIIAKNFRRNKRINDDFQVTCKRNLEEDTFHNANSKSKKEVSLDAKKVNKCEIVNTVNNSKRSKRTKKTNLKPTNDLQFTSSPDSEDDIFDKSMEESSADTKLRKRAESKTTSSLPKVNNKCEKENISNNSKRIKQTKDINSKHTDDFQFTYKHDSGEDLFNNEDTKRQEVSEIRLSKSNSDLKIETKSKDENKTSKVSKINSDTNSIEVTKHNSKTFKKRLSMKKSSSIGSFDIEADDILSLSFDDDEIKFKPKKRKTALCLSDDDADLIDLPISNSQNEILINQKVNWNVKIKEVMERIEKKELKLKNLQQAAVYKKLHDVNELENVTQLWKNGCKEALHCLLDNLKEHGPINMPSLLTRLNIPQDFLTYNENEETFV